MTDPATSNSGFSAIADPMSAFLSGQTITSGSSGWLKDTFLEKPDRANSIINYESVLHTMISEDGADITVVVPADGVVSADYPLSTITVSDQGEQVAELAGWFAELPDALTDTYRRPTTANTTLPAELSSQTIIEALIDAYTKQFRVPGETTFAINVSGSMLGQRISLLKDTMSDLISGGETTDLANVALRDRENSASDHTK